MHKRSDLGQNWSVGLSKICFALQLLTVEVNKKSAIACWLQMLTNTDFVEIETAGKSLDVSFASLFC